MNETRSALCRACFLRNQPPARARSARAKPPPDDADPVGIHRKASFAVTARPAVPQSGGGAPTGTPLQIAGTVPRTTQKA